MHIARSVGLRHNSDADDSSFSYAHWPPAAHSGSEDRQHTYSRAYLHSAFTQCETTVLLQAHAHTHSIQRWFSFKRKSRNTSNSKIPTEHHQPNEVAAFIRRLVLFCTDVLCCVLAWHTKQRTQNAPAAIPAADWIRWKSETNSKTRYILGCIPIESFRRMQL